MVLSASLLTRNGKGTASHAAIVSVHRLHPTHSMLGIVSVVLVARQFVEITRIRLEVGKYRSIVGFFFFFVLDMGRSLGFIRADAGSASGVPQAAV